MNSSRPIDSTPPATGWGCGGAGEPRRAKHEHDLEPEQARRGARRASAAARRGSGPVSSLPGDQHHDGEHEEHRDGAGVDDDLGGGEELGPQHQIEPGHAREVADEEQRAVDGVASEDEPAAHPTATAASDPEGDERHARQTGPVGGNGHRRRRARRRARPARATAASPSCRSCRRGCTTRTPGCRCPSGWRPPGTPRRSTRRTRTCRGRCRTARGPSRSRGSGARWRRCRCSGPGTPSRTSCTPRSAASRPPGGPGGAGCAAAASTGAARPGTGWSRPARASSPPSACSVCCHMLLKKCRAVSPGRPAPPTT